MSERGNLLSSETAAFQLDTSEQGYSRVGSWVQSASTVHAASSILCIQWCTPCWTIL